MNKKRTLNRDVFISGLGLGLLYYFFSRTEILVFAGIYLPLCFFWNKLKVANHQFWMQLTSVIQSITSPILFGAIFVLVLLPIGLLFQIFSKKKKRANSTFKTVDQPIDASFFDVPW